MTEGRKLWIGGRLAIPESELEYQCSRASGPGGQHVNVTDTAVQLRFHVLGSPSLPDEVRVRLLAIAGRSVTSAAPGLLQVPPTAPEPRGGARAVRGAGAEGADAAAPARPHQGAAHLQAGSAGAQGAALPHQAPAARTAPGRRRLTRNSPFFRF